MRNSVEQQVRAIAQKVVDRLATDVQFQKEVIDDPAKALARAGFERELDQIAWPAVGAAITECTTTCGYRSCTRTCVGTCSISCRVASL
jgi:hypothetical protein